MPDPFLDVFFLLIGNDLLFCIAKSSYRTGSGPHVPSERSRDTDHLRPSKLAARTLHSVEHTPSKFGHDPWPVRRGLVAAVKCGARKARFFDAVEQNETSQSLVWVSTPQR